MKYLTLLLTLFSFNIYAEEKKMSYSLTLEKGLESELNYGYFYATRSFNTKFSATYGASLSIDSPTSEPYFDMYSQTINLNYSLTNNLSVYMLNDINPHFERTETWVGTTYHW